MGEENLGQCEYGTPRAGNTSHERCETTATLRYLGYGEDDPVFLCPDHFEEFMYGDYLSGPGDF